jgi:hypothetical protein
MPRPSRLCGGVSGKIPTDKEVQQDQTFKGLPRKDHPMGLVAAPLSWRKSGHHQTESHDGRDSRTYGAGEVSL